jgi:hypothetical protein
MIVAPCKFTALVDLPVLALILFKLPVYELASKIPDREGFAGTLKQILWNSTKKATYNYNVNYDVISKCFSIYLQYFLTKLHTAEAIPVIEEEYKQLMSATDPDGQSAVDPEEQAAAPEEDPPEELEAVAPIPEEQELNLSGRKPTPPNDRGTLVSIAIKFIGLINFPLGASPELPKSKGKGLLLFVSYF